jgi:indolepyruvate ferredoxin oxidoreductase alpha subunit
MTLLILDNETVGMTGAQDTVLPQSRLADVILGLGVPADQCTVVDAHPRKVHENAGVLRKAIEHKGLSVVIARRECKVAAKRRQRAAAAAAATDDQAAAPDGQEVES